MHAKSSCSYTHPLLKLYAAVTELCGRIFGIWTLLTCALCCICARNPCVPSIYGRLQQAEVGCLTLWTNVQTKVATGGSLCSTSLWPAGATLFSFVAALCFFLLELFVYQTVGWKSALQPLIVAGESCNSGQFSAIWDSISLSVLHPAGVSTLWMGAGWNYYTTLSLDPE